MTMTQTVTPVAVPAQATARWRLLARKPTFLIGAAILSLWIVCAVFSEINFPHLYIIAVMNRVHVHCAADVLARLRPEPLRETDRFRLYGIVRIECTGRLNTRSARPATRSMLLVNESREA